MKTYLRRKELAALFVLAVMLGSFQPGCAKAPPNLTPQAQQAFYKHQVLKGLDILRDFAIEGEATTPKVIPTATARDVVETHKSIVTVMQAADAGWQAAVSAGLDELLKRRSDSEKQKFGPYVALVKALLKEIQ